MTQQHYDAIVIGSGPAGEGAAMTMSKAGLKVAVIEQYPQVGGGCTHWGTIPSKTLRHSISLLNEFSHNPLFAKYASNINPCYTDLLHAARNVISEQVATRTQYYQRNKVEVIHGFARFIDSRTISVTSENQQTTTLSADNFVIATGSTPYHPTDIDFSHPAVCDSDTILELDNTPQSITIYGAGVIGCEYASIFIQLGVKINLVNTRDRLLSFLDEDITDALSYHLSNQGVMIRHKETFTSVETVDDGVVLHCESGKKFKSDVLFWANGRSGNTANMNLDAVGVETDGRGHVSVNERFQSAHAHIFAIGDVAGPPGLASASYDQGRFCGTIIAHGNSKWELITDMPTGIYTLPEISSIGKTEAELTKQKVPYEVGRALFKSIARAQITGSTVGMLKILFHTESLQILGIHCFGEQASEILHIGQAIMSQQGDANTIRYFAETTFNYPTMAEAYRVAALNGLNRLF